MTGELISIGPSNTVNLLKPTDPFYNIDLENVQKARRYFSTNPFIAPNGQIGTEGFGVSAAIK